MSTDPKQLPAVEWLGYSLDLTSLPPFDVTKVQLAVIKDNQILVISPDEKTRIEVIRGVSYKVPRSILVSKDTKVLQSKFITYKSGSEAANAFKTDPTVFTRFLAVNSTGDNSHYSITKAFLHTEQYAFFDFNISIYQADLRDYADLLDETLLKQRLRDLPLPFSSKKRNTVKKYRDFFQSIGSHVILGTTYGAGYQLVVRAPNSDKNIVNNYARDVHASVHGITNSGHYDSGVFREAQYKEFDKVKKSATSVVGGEPTLLSDLRENPADYTKFQAWSASPLDYPDLKYFRAVPIWILMKDANSSDVRKYADHLQSAFQFVEHPIIITPVAFHIDAYWAEFVLLSPDALISPYPDDDDGGEGAGVDAADSPDDSFVLNSTTVRLGRETSTQRLKATIEFLIINDGSPITFSIAHGKGKGAAITINNIQYENYAITDGTTNKKEFKDVPVVDDTAPVTHPQPSLESPRTNY